MEQQPNTPESKGRSNTALLALVVLLLISNVVMLYLLMQKNKDVQTTGQELAKVTSDKDNVTKLLEDMLKFYGQECLSFYFPPKPQLLNWVPMMVRRPVFNFSPLRHVLLYNFINQQQYQLSLFGNPVPVEQWKCINAACKHYEKSAFGTITTFYDSTVKRNVSIVSCECGMKYKAGPKGKYKTGIRIYTIQDYGDVWINKVHEEYKKGKSIAAIAKTMKTGWRAINRLLNEKNEKPDLKFE